MVRSESQQQDGSGPEPAGRLWLLTVEFARALHVYGGTLVSSTMKKRI